MRTMLDAMPKIQALTSKQTSQPQISANSRQHNQPAALDADALAIAEQMGNDPLDVAKYV
jgi:phage I-like protein